jgi:hypothetical protein
MALVFDPNTNQYVDNATGRVFQDPQGLTPTADPGLISQATRNLQIANELFARLGGDQERYRQVFRQQAELARSLDNTIAGKGPSVVGRQLEAGVEAGREQAESMASGVSGAAAPLARYAAIQASGDLTARANQAGAVARAQEVSEAQRTKAAVLGQQAGEANTAAGVNVVGMNAASGNAVAPAAKQADLDQRDEERMQAFITNMINGGGNALAMGATA